MTRTLRNTTIALIAAALFASPTFAAISGVADLEITTPTTTIAAGGISNTRYNDGTVDGDADVDSTADITLAFEARIDDITPGGNRSLFEFGGGTVGFSLLARSAGDLTIQVEQGGTQIGGNASAYVLPAHKVGTTVTFVASVDLDAGGGTLRLFADGDLVYEGSGGPLTDWAGTNDGGFFDSNGQVLAAAFSEQNFAGPTGSEATALSGLRFYEGIAVSQESSVTFAFGTNTANSDAMFGAGGYDNASDFLANGVGSDTLTDSVTGNNLNMTVDPSGNTNLATDVGLGDDANASTSWNAGDEIDLTFDHDIRLDTVWANHGNGSTPRTVEVQVILNPGVDQIDLGILSFTGVKQLDPTHALEFGDVPGGDTILRAGDILRLIAPNSTDNGRIAGITVQVVVPAPAALPAGLAMLGLTAMRRRRRVNR